MNRLIVCVVLFCASVLLAAASLTLERTIPLPGVDGRIDHFAVDPSGHRLFVAALGNNTVEVIDLTGGQVVHSIAGLAEPQGVCFIDDLNRLYVANGGDGTVRIFDGSSFAPLGSIQLDEDADNVRYDSATKQLFVGHGGGLSMIDVTINKIVADVPLNAHPESFQLEKNGLRAFVNVPNAHQVAVVDRRQKKVVATWSVGFAAANFPMALDEARHRLFVGCRLPARLVIFDTDSGKEVAKLALHGDCDDLFFDPINRQLYASCGEGFIDMLGQTDGDHYRLKELVSTEAGARTCLVDGDQLYLAVPKRAAHRAELRCYRIGR